MRTRCSLGLSLVLRLGARASLLGASAAVVACGPAQESGGGEPKATGGDGAGSGGAPSGTGGSLPPHGVAGWGGATGDTGGSSSGDASSTGGADGTGGAGDDGGEDGCPFSGRITYQLNGPDSWPADARQRITDAMDSALEYYNCYADLEKAITVDYNPGVPTAQANVDGWLSFGSNQAYMQVATAMHEVAHTLGVGYYPWAELMDGGRWIGAHVDALMKSIPVEERDDDDYSQRDYITGDAQHFWPYGLNQASEYKSEWSLINHVRIVAAMQMDKADYLAR